MSRLLLSCLIVGTLGVGNPWAHHQVPGKAHPVTTTVRITQPALAGGQPLAPGMYELVITDERPLTPTGGPNESERYVDFVANGMVVAREIAEVFPASERPIGTSSTSGSPRAVVQMLKGGEFLRVAVNSTDARYLIHLPVSQR